MTFVVNKLVCRFGLYCRYDFVVRTQNEKMHKFLDRNMDIRRKRRVSTADRPAAANTNGSEQVDADADADANGDTVIVAGTPLGDTASDDLRRRTHSQSYAEVWYWVGCSLPSLALSSRSSPYKACCMRKTCNNCAYVVPRPRRLTLEWKCSYGCRRKWWHRCQNVQ